ncbi:MAG: hypothetical protein HY423_06865 [Candidatus Lambdaproteobacteria bacterium]|nr:hypothetical protein [Candidatus Lambdaproteobacteria bacterium]
MARQQVPIDTYFGFFARSVFTALAGSLGQRSGVRVAVARVFLSTTNTLKLRWSEVECVLLPTLAQPTDLPFVLALTPRDVTALTALAQGRTSLQRLMEEAVGSTIEPFNFIGKSRNKLQELQFSRNVTGLTASHLRGEVSYTMAEARLRPGRGEMFSVRLLVSAATRDAIETRAEDKATQRALFAVNLGAYQCQPQWEPPPPPPELEQGTSLSETLLHGWLQSLFGRNDGTMANTLFRQPAALQSELAKPESLRELARAESGLTVIRLVLNEAMAQEVFVAVPLATEEALMALSRSGQQRFLGDLFRVLFGEAGQLWERFAGAPAAWKHFGVRKLPADAVRLLEQRLEGGGLVVRQTARFDEGTLRWLLAITPHAWHALMRLAARGMARDGLWGEGQAPNRQAIFNATGWQRGTVPWPTVLTFCTERDLQELIRRLGQVGLKEAHLAGVAASLKGDWRQRWFDAMPVMLRERAQAYPLAPGEAALRDLELTRVLIELTRQDRLPEGRLTAWLALYGEMVWSRRQALLDRLLPLRHLVYGMDRVSLGRLMFDCPNAVVIEMLCWAEFMVLDQVRRAVSPGFGIRLLEEIGVRRVRASAYACQEAQLAVYRQAQEGLARGRYLIRATPARQLRDLLRWLDDPAIAAGPRAAATAAG